MFGKGECKLIVMCNLYSIFSCISILKSRKLKLYCILNDRADFSTVCHMFDSILMDKISTSLKFFVNSDWQTSCTDILYVIL